jgi:formamidopyrimidine-DNA glycosylase
MPELPEVEVLTRHLQSVLPGGKVRAVRVLRAKVLAPTSPRLLSLALSGARFSGVSRRGKYLLFRFRKGKGTVQVLGHLGMTGRMYVAPARQPLPKHAAVVLHFGRQNFIFEDTRYFGRFTLDLSPLARLGPEPLGDDFAVAAFAARLKPSRQCVKVRLLDQSVVAGVGNIYASEALFRAGINPRTPARRLKPLQIERLRDCIREVLADAIASGSTVPLNWSGAGDKDGLFYFGRSPDTPDYYEERLRVYDKAGKPCVRCGSPIRRAVQAARSTYYCPICQR